MKKQEIIKANAALMIAIMFIDLDTYSDTGHPRAYPVRCKIESILQHYKTKNRADINIKANILAQTTLEKIQAKMSGEVEVNVVAMTLLSNLEDIIELPKRYSMPSSLIVTCINELADINEVTVFNTSADVADEIIKELYS